MLIYPITNKAVRYSSYGSEVMILSCRFSRLLLAISFTYLQLSSILILIWSFVGSCYEAATTLSPFNSRRNIFLVERTSTFRQSVDPYNRVIANHHYIYGVFVSGCLAYEATVMNLCCNYKNIVSCCVSQAV